MKIEFKRLLFVFVLSFFFFAFVVSNHFKTFAQNTIDAFDTVLKLIQRRIQVEMDVEDRKDIKLLAQLLRESSADGRQRLLLSSLRKIEDLIEFETFVQAGIDHIRRAGDIGRRNDRDKDSVQAPVGTLAMMKEVLEQIRLLKVNGHGDDTVVYSTKQLSAE